MDKLQTMYQLISLTLAPTLLVIKQIKRALKIAKPGNKRLVEESI